MNQKWMTLFQHRRFHQWYRYPQSRLLQHRPLRHPHNSVRYYLLGLQHHHYFLVMEK